MRVQPKAVGMLSIYTAIHQSVEPNRMLCIRFWNAREREGERVRGESGHKTCCTYFWESLCCAVFKSVFFLSLVGSIVKQ